jgi:hypothetical protein
VLETSSGRQVIIDREHAIDPQTAAEIAGRWPTYAVAQPAAGAPLRDVFDSVLGVAGYSTVLRGRPFTFGGELTVRYTPDFLVVRDERDLLDGEVRAISVVDPADALPGELREMAEERQVRLVELSPDGTAAGPQRAPSTDPVGTVTTMVTGSPLALIGEIAATLGLDAAPLAPGPGSADGLAVAGIRISRGIGEDALVVVNAGSGDGPDRGTRPDGVIDVGGPADVPAAIASLLAHFDFPAIGPAVDLFRTPPPGGTPRFVISVPGWLVQTGARRLLITGAATPSPARLYLTREGIDVFEYRLR